MNNAVLKATLLAHGYFISADLKASANSSHPSRSGKLGRSFKEKVFSINGDVLGLSFTMPRYGYILNHGVAAQTVKRKETQYQTAGFKGSSFIVEVLDRHTGKIADDITALYGKQVAEQIRF